MGWLGLAAYVAIVDYHAARTGRTTLSTTFARAPRWLTVPAAAYLAAHLFDLLPRRYDALTLLADHVRGNG